MGNLSSCLNLKKIRDKLENTVKETVISTFEEKILPLIEKQLESLNEVKEVKESSDASVEVKEVIDLTEPSDVIVEVSKSTEHVTERKIISTVETTVETVETTIETIETTV